MKKRIISILVIVVILTTIIGCKNNKNEQFILRITESSWSGWTENYKPEEITKDYDVELDKEYEIKEKAIAGGISFKIKEINKDNVVIETKTSFSDTEEGVDMSTEKKEFTLYLDKEKKLVTQSTDQGDIYKITLMKK